MARYLLPLALLLGGCSLQVEEQIEAFDADTLRCGWVVTSEFITPPADSEANGCWRFVPASRTTITLTSDNLTACDLPDDQREIVVGSATSVTYWATIGRVSDDQDTLMQPVPCTGGWLEAQRAARIREGAP